MLFQTTIAGSLPKPSWLAEPNRLWAPWRLTGDDLAAAKRDATVLVIKEQEDAGIDIVAVTDANTALAGQQVAGYHVTPPSALRSVEADALFVAVVGESAAVLADARPLLHPSVALAVCPSTAPITIAPSRGIEEAEQGRPHAEC
jgi:hypothetical protein